MTLSMMDIGYEYKIVNFLMHMNIGPMYNKKYLQTGMEYDLENDFNLNSPGGERGAIIILCRKIAISPEPKIWSK